MREQECKCKSVSSLWGDGDFAGGGWPTSGNLRPRPPCKVELGHPCWAARWHVTARQGQDRPGPEGLWDQPPGPACPAICPQPIAAPLPSPPVSIFRPQRLPGVYLGSVSTGNPKGAGFQPVPACWCPGADCAPCPEAQVGAAPNHGGDSRDPGSTRMPPPSCGVEAEALC